MALVAVQAAVGLAAAVALSTAMDGVLLACASIAAGAGAAMLLSSRTKADVSAGGPDPDRRAISHAAHELRSQMALVTLLANQLEGDPAKAVEEEVATLATLVDRLARVATPRG